MSAAVTLTKYVFAFLWEIIFGKQSFKSACRNNKSTVFLLCAFIVSFWVNCITVPGTVNTAMKVHKLQATAKECQNTKDEVAKLQVENAALKKSVAMESKREKQLTPFSNDLINKLDAEARQTK